MADFLLLVFFFSVWSLAGFVLFCMWVGRNGGLPYFNHMPRWKRWAITFLGGPIIWLSEALD